MTIVLTILTGISGSFPDVLGCAELLGEFETRGRLPLQALAFLGDLGPGLWKFMA